ncbi:hypothetical protein AOQ73_26815 [Bradyrhizobium pachyrhizi]|nr:hypothetical protein AOQ73_26815 [Bradyrhizobium pachyrhizi]
MVPVSQDSCNFQVRRRDDFDQPVSLKLSSGIVADRRRKLALIIRSRLPSKAITNLFQGIVELGEQWTHFAPSHSLIDASWTKAR